MPDQDLSQLKIDYRLHRVSSGQTEKYLYYGLG